MDNLPEKIPREEGNLNDGQPYERKLLLFVAARLSQNEEVKNFWAVSNPTGICKIDDVVVRVSFKDSAKKDIAVFVQAKLTSPHKILWLNVNNNKPTQKCYEIKLAEYVKAFTDVIEMMSSNKPETEELRKLLNGVDVKDYFVCILTNMEKVKPDLQCKQFVGSHPVCFSDTGKRGQYRQFDFANTKFNTNFYKQLYVFLGQPNFEDIDSSIAPLLGEDYKHRLENLHKIVKDFMQRSKFCWVLTKPAFEMNWFKVLAMDWMYVDSENVKKINPKFERLWQKILANKKVINLREEKMWPLLAYYYQCVIIKEVDENFKWQTGMTLSIKNSIKQKYSENVTDLRELLFLLWRERKLSLAIKSDFTHNILKFLDQFKTVEGGIVVFSSEEFPDVTTHVKQISDVEVLEEVMKLEVSLQGRPPVALSDIGEWQIFSELKIAQVLAWSSNLEEGRHHTVGPVLRTSDENNITRAFTRKEEKKAQDQRQNYLSQYFAEISPIMYVHNETTSALKQNEYDNHFSKHQREKLTVEDVVELAGPGLHIITAEPGFGKSTVLEELAHKYTPKDFVIYVILRDCLEDLERDDTWPSIEADPILYFFSKMAGESDDNISGPIIHLHKTSKRLCLFLDGFDEILPLHGIKLSSLIASILEKNDIPVFCTTRPHGEEQITKNPMTIYLELSPFGSNQIRQYLNRIKIEARDIEKLFAYDFLSNPLHLNMISEIYLNAGNTKDITRGKMYKIFIEIKHKTYNEKIGLRKNYARRQTERSLKYHRKLALVDIFGKEGVTSEGLISDTELVEILEDIGEHNIGIVDVSKQIGKFRFHHRTFAEYLVADWLLQMANQGSLNKTPFKYFYEEVMRHHKNICSMVNELSSCFILWSEARKQLHINSDLFKLDEFGRNVAHAATSHEEQKLWMKSVCKSRLFYRMDSVLQWTCREFINMKRNEIGSTVVQEINKDYPSRTPLTVSEEWGNEMCTKLLTAVDSEHTVDIKSILKSNQALLGTGLGITAFHSAITTGNRSIVELILNLRPMLLNEQDDNDNTALHIACAFGCRDIVALLLENHVSLDIVNKDTWSPLEMAAAEGHLKIVSLLLEHIRQIDVHGHASSTKHYNQLLYQKTVPIASKNERWDVVALLIEHGADPTPLIDDGWAAIHFAAQNGKLEILKLLSERSFNVNAKTNRGVTPLHIAIGNNHLDATEWLLENGADPTLSMDIGWAAIHYAAENGKLAILKLFSERDLNVNAQITRSGLTPLYIAIRNNYLDATEWLLEHGANPTLSDDEGWAAIHYAAQNGQLEILKLLSERDLNVNAKISRGATPLHIAIGHNHLDATEWFLEHGADPTLSIDDGWTAIHYAAQNGKIEILKLLSERGLNVNAKINIGLTPLYMAICNNHLDATEWLLEHGADPTLSDDEGWAAIHITAQNGQIEILTLLLARELNVNAKTNKGWTPLHIAIHNNRLHTMELLLEHGADATLRNNVGWAAIHFAAKKGQVEILMVLLEMTLEDVNAKTTTGITPLHIAIFNNQLDTTECLLEHDADATLSNDEGWAAIHITARNGQLEILTLLLERELNVNAKTNNGWTPLHIAIHNNHPHTTELLLEHGADPTIWNDVGWAAIHYAANNGQLEILMLWLERGLNVNAKTNTGGTLLYIAIQNNHLNFIKSLLEHGADPTLSNVDGWAAMHIAAEQGHLEILKLLLERRVDVNAKTTTGITPLHIAIFNNQLDTTECLLEHGADATLSNDEGWAAIHITARNGQLEILRLWLERGLNVNAKTNTGATPLYIAIQNNHLNFVESLLEQGADPTLSNVDGWAAMHIAAEKGHLQILKLLLERRLAVNAKTTTGITPLHIAILKNQLDTTKCLLEHGADATLSNDEGWAALHITARNGQLEILTLLLERDLNVNAKTNNGWTPLHIAIHDNHLDATELLLEHGADPTLWNDGGWAAMHYAAKNGQLEILKLWLERGLNVNAKTRAGATPLTISIDNEQWDFVKWLLDHGADPKQGISINSITNMGETLFASAITSKHYDTVKWLLEHRVDPTLPDEYGWSAVHYAAIEGHLEILSLLLETGLNINAETDIGETPLTICIDNEHWDCVNWLLDHSADPTLSDEDGWAAIHYATSKGHLDLLELLLKTGLNVDAKTHIGETLVTIAISCKHFNTVEWLLDHGADPTLSDEDGWTALHFAAATGQIDMLKLLLERGLDVHSKSNSGETALIISFENDHWGCVKWLLEYGADHAVSRDDGWSAVHYAAMAGKLDILSLLINRGLNVNAKSNTGQTPLTISIDNDQWDTVKWLLQHGADHRLSRADGWGCIHFAAKRGQLEILVILLDRGVNVNASTNLNETPLTIAINYENWDTTRWLVEHDADPTLSDDDGWSSIHFAAKRGQLEILVILLDRGVNVNASTNLNETPLTIAINYENWDTTRWLVEHDADPTLSDDDGWSSIHFAAKRGQLEILVILLNRGVNVNASTNLNETPLTIAINYENWETTRWLVEHDADPTLSDDDGWSSIHFAPREDN